MHDILCMCFYCYVYTMTSRPDLIKSILRNSTDYTEAQLKKIPDEELVMIKLKAEAAHDKLSDRKFTKNIIIGKSRAKLMRRGRRRRK